MDEKLKLQMALDTLSGAYVQVEASETGQKPVLREPYKTCYDMLKKVIDNTPKKVIKYIVVLNFYEETDGLDTTVEVFDTKAAAMVFLESHYNTILNTYFNNKCEMEWNDKDGESFSIGGYNEYSSFQRFDGAITPKEINNVISLQ